MTPEDIGWLGGILLAWSGLPLAIGAFKQGSVAISGPFLWAWYIGEWLALYYTLYKIEGVINPLTFNYFLNILFISVVLKYKYWPRKVYGR